MTIVRSPLPREATRLDAPTEEACSARRGGAGLHGLQVADIDRAARLAAMRTGELGSVHSWELVTAVDGPGTRMTLFLNGCPLRCLYCQNPDTFAMKDGVPVMADAVLERLRRYLPVFRASGGGLTISGGEVLMQPSFATRLIRGAKAMGVHTALDTSGFLGAHASDELLADTDLLLLDVKSGDPDTYRRVTGRELEPTLEFGERVARRGDTEIWIRFVLVPELTDDPDNVELVARYAASLNEITPGAVTRVEVLPFHQMGRDKWRELGRTYPLEDAQPPTVELLDRVRGQFRSYGLTVY